MISEAERKQIEEIAARYPAKRAGCVHALKIVQMNHGWVSDQDLECLAEILEMSPEELDGVATFYSHVFRKPVGRHVILVCDSVSCWILGYEKMLDHLVRRLGIRFGETSPDGRFTLLPIACLGACDQAPAMMVDDTLYGDLTPEKIDLILEKHQ